MNLPPLAELHLHIEGTLEPELIMELAARNGVDLPWGGLEELREQYRFEDLQSFLDLYYANMAVLQRREDFAEMTRAYLERARQAGVRHAEIMVDPQAHLHRGVDLATSIGGVADVLARSEQDYGISTVLIAAFLRDHPVEEAKQVLEDLLAMGAPIDAVGLDSAEVDNPPEKFVALYDRARAAGLRLVAHAGEEGPCSYVSQALDLLRVDRVDHGVRCLEDDALVRRLVAEQVPLTVCPLSNVRLRGVASLEEHPITEMLRLGLNVSVNSDDPAYFGGYVDENFRCLAEEFDLTRADIAALAANSFRGSFAEPRRREEMLALIRRWEEGEAPTP